jgi:competence protein ComEC
MNKLRDYLPLHFVLFLILGIVVQFYTRFWHYGFIRLFILGVSISLLLLFFKKRVMTSILSFVIFFFVGISSVYIHNDRNYKNYYKNYVSAKSFATFKVVKVLKSGFYNDKYVVEVIGIDNQKTRGNVLVNIRKDSTKTSLKVDENIHSKAHFKELVGPLNPHQFHYKSYLAKQGIYEQLFLDKDQYRRIGFGYSSLKGLAARFRNKIQKSLLTYNFTKNELGIISALLLGQRQDISKELLTDYQKAGAIHILAVSGLHVGVFLWMLSFLFLPI